MAYSFADFADPVINFFSNMDSSTKVLGSIFIILFIILNITFSKTFKEKPSTGKVLAFVFSFLIVYVLNKTNISYGYAFDYLGYDTGIASTIISLILIIGLIFIAWKVGLSNIFLLIGILLVGVGLVDTFVTDIIYETGIVFIIGIPLLLIGLYLWNRKRKIKKMQQTGMQPPKSIGVRTIIKGIIFLAGLILLFINPIFGGIILFIWLIIILLSWNKKQKIKNPNRFYNKKIGSIKGMKKGIWKGTKFVGKKGIQTGKYIGNKYDWEKEKKQAKAIGKGVKWTGNKIWSGTKSAGSWFGNKAVSAKDWAKQKREQAKIEKENYKLAKENLKIQKEKAEAERKIEDKAAKKRKRENERNRIAHEAKLKDVRIDELVHQKILFQKEINKLKRKIKSSSVIEQSRIEREIKNLENKIKANNKELKSL